MKWNAGVSSHFFLHYEGWIGSGKPWANEVTFLWNLSQSSIEHSTLNSKSSALLLDNGGPTPHTHAFKRYNLTNVVLQPSIVLIYARLSLTGNVVWAAGISSV